MAEKREKWGAVGQLVSFKQGEPSSRNLLYNIAPIVNTTALWI